MKMLYFVNLRNVALSKIGPGFSKKYILKLNLDFFLGNNMVNKPQFSNKNPKHVLLSHILSSYLFTNQI